MQSGIEEADDPYGFREYRDCRTLEPEFRVDAPLHLRKLLRQSVQGRALFWRQSDTGGPDRILRGICRGMQRVAEINRGKPENCQAKCFGGRCEATRHFAQRQPILCGWWRASWPVAPETAS